MTHTLDALRARLRIDARRWPDRHGEYHADCPFCGKESARGQTHFSLFPWQETLAYKCHVCGEGGGLRNLLRNLELHDTPVRLPEQHREPPKPRNWQQHPERYLQAFCAAPTRLQDWQSYKPLTLDSIAHWRLGAGVLPSSRCEHRRLIVPVYDSGRVVAFHGRAYLPGDTDAKWLTAGGSRKDVLFNADRLRPGAMVVICENMIDCILLMQQRSWVAVASGGVGWNERFTRQIAASNPASVLVWLDNDAAGQRSADEIVPSLCEAGVPTTRYRWPATAPAKADVGTALEDHL